MEGEEKRMTFFLFRKLHAASRHIRNNKSPCVSRQKHMSHFCVRKFSWKSVSCARDSFGTRTHTQTHARNGTKRCYSRILFCINKDSSGTASGRGEAAKNMQIHLRSGPKDISDDNLPAWVQLHIHLRLYACVCSVCFAVLWPLLIWISHLHSECELQLIEKLPSIIIINNNVNMNMNFNHE